MLLFQHQEAGGGSNGCSEATLEEILWQILIKLTLEQLPLSLYMLILLNRCHNVTLNIYQYRY